MFKLSIFTKLFLILLLCMATISGALLVSVHWSFKQGFNRYLLEAEANQLDQLIQILQTAYRQHGSWDFLKGDAHEWIHLLRQGLGDRHIPPKLLRTPWPRSQDVPPDQRNFGSRPPPPNFAELDHTPPPPRHGHDFAPESNPPDSNTSHVLARFLGSRIQLLDANRRPVAGFPRQQQTEVLRPVTLDQQPIGWLKIQSSDLITNHLAQLFVAQQIRNNYLIAAFTVGFAVFCSLLLARKLLAPIKRISNCADSLAQGHYDTQVSISSRDEIGQLADNFNVLARTLKNNEQARRRWIADISHELRTPLAILRGEIEAVQDGIREFSPDNVKSLYTEVMSLNRLVDDLYELSLSDLGNNHYQTETLDIVNILQEVVHNQQPRFRDRQLELRAHFDSAARIEVIGDSRRLHQLFSNLCENSRRYTEPGGFCEISVQCAGKRIAIDFQDTPPGVPDQALHKLFERLYRVDESRNRELGGAGLGLAICAAIVNAHHGAIHAHHSVYGGLGIHIALPRL